MIKLEDVPLLVVPFWEIRIRGGVLRAIRNIMHERGVTELSKSEILDTTVVVLSVRWRRVADGNAWALSVADGEACYVEWDADLKWDAGRLHRCAIDIQPPTIEQSLDPANTRLILKAHKAAVERYDGRESWNQYRMDLLKVIDPLRNVEQLENGASVLEHIATEIERSE